MMILKKNCWLFCIFIIISCADSFKKLPKEIGTYFKTNLEDPSSFELVSIRSEQISVLEYDSYFTLFQNDRALFKIYWENRLEFLKIKHEILRNEDRYPFTHSVNYTVKDSLGVETSHWDRCLTRADGTLIGCYDDHDSYSLAIYENFFEPKIKHLLQI